MISTGAFVRIGSTYGNLMVGVSATNEKLRRRAARIVAEITGKTTGVDEALEKCGYDVRTACIMLVRQVGQEDATKALIAAKGSLRKALSPS